MPLCGVEARVHKAVGRVSAILVRTRRVLAHLPLFVPLVLPHVAALFCLCGFAWAFRLW
jgi:hypothetical protein